MTIQKVNNIFSEEQLVYINNLINNLVVPLDENNEYISCRYSGIGIHDDLGRLQLGEISEDLTQDIVDTMFDIVNNVTEAPMALDHASCVEYSNKFGKPNLPPHRDADTNDLIINFQLSSNTSWDIGINLQTYTLEDNSALVFNGNTEIHWRVHKDFKDGEFVRMIFIRFHKIENQEDYSYLNINESDEVFKEFRDFRDSLK